MKIIHRLRNKLKNTKEFYNVYTSGLNRREIEQLLKKDTLDAFSYFKGKTSIDDNAPIHASPSSFLHGIKEIFISFVMQLTPARRLFYGIAIIAFLLGLINYHLLYLIGSFVIFNLLLALELANKLTTRDELEIAREIQQSLQPFNIPESQLLSIATFYRPARLVGGDFFDIVQPDSDRLISIVGDVSDKGIAAALYAAYTQSMFQSLSQTKQSPSNIFHSLNDLISRRLREGDFITAVIAFFDLNEKSVTIARAGHSWPLYYCADTKGITELKTRGLSIGLVENVQFADQLEEQKIFLNQGDLLFLYSDGVTEATNPQDLMFDIDRLKKVIEKNVYESSETIVDRINSQLHEFAKSDDLQDDVTMVAFKIK
ncbi:MAG: serine/threonine-protein phosphatase [Proteobacteria bacterium]|nr:serine/threonine-protein phosphatase [Pseudomonadota bacterium]